MNEQIIVKNLLVSYSRSKVGDSAILFLHGWRSEAGAWRVIVDSGQWTVNSSIYCLDFPGFGKSQTPKVAMTVGDYAEIVKEFIEKLDLKNVIIVGHSFGGRVGIKLAAQNPNLISKLVLVDAAGFAMNSRRKSQMKLIAKILKPFFKPQFMQGLRKKIYKVIGAEDYVATPELQKTFVNVTSEDLTGDMKKITCPALIITGEQDQDTPMEFGKRMNSLIPNSKFEIIKNAGHFSFIDKPQEFIKLLNEFIQSN